MIFQRKVLCLFLKVSTIDPWTTWVWTVPVHLHMVSSVNTVSPFVPVGFSPDYAFNQPLMDSSIFATELQSPTHRFKILFSVHSWSSPQMWRAHCRIKNYTEIRGGGGGWRLGSMPLTPMFFKSQFHFKIAGVETMRQSESPQHKPIKYFRYLTIHCSYC